MKDGLEMNIVDTGDVDGDSSFGLRDHNSDGLGGKGQANRWCDGSTTFLQHILANMRYRGLRFIWDFVIDRSLLQYLDCGREKTDANKTGYALQKWWVTH